MWPPHGLDFAGCVDGCALVSCHLSIVSTEETDGIISTVQVWKLSFERDLVVALGLELGPDCLTFQSLGFPPLQWP